MYFNQYGQKRQLNNKLTDQELEIVNNLVRLLAEIVDPYSCKSRTLGRRALKSLRKAMNIEKYGDSFTKDKYLKLFTKLEWHLKCLGNDLNSFGL